MKEEYLSPEITTGIEQEKRFDDLTILSEIEIKYNPKVKPSERPKVMLAGEAYKLIKPFFNDCMHHHEEAWIMLLNRKYKVLGVAKIGSGGLDGTIFDQRIILQYMLKCNAYAVILFHNHPSQELSFSQLDMQATKAIMQSCRLLKLNCLDHIIVGEDSYCSYTEEGYY